MNNELVKIDELVDNPMPRVAVCLCLDTSGSMGAVEGDYDEDTGETVEEDGQTWKIVKGGTTRMHELEEGIKLFKQNILADDTARRSAEICIVTFNDKAGCIVNFTSVENLKDKYGFKAEGGTALGEGVNEALNCLEQRKEEYKSNGVEYYQPWLIIMTDGKSNGSKEEFERACDRVKLLRADKKISVFPIAIGNGVDLQELERISGKKPLKLDGLKFKELFTWLSKSVSLVSHSRPGDIIKLDTTGIEGWVEL